MSRASGPRFELPYAAWPEADRAAWEALFRKGDLLDGQGAAVHWAEATRRTNAQHYARWLAWLATNGLLEAEIAPHERATPARVEAYARSLIERVAPRTAASGLIGVKCVLQRMAPQAEWRWLKDLTNRLDRWAKPSRDMTDRLLPAAEIFARLLADLEQRARGPLTKRHAQIRFRDTLLLAILTTCPTRLGNVAMAEIGTHLRLVKDEWHLLFDDDETKTGEPSHHVIPSELAPFLALYLEKAWPAFPRPEGDVHLWPASEGRPMAGNTIYSRVTKRTRELFGVAINPHAFRSIAATFLAENSPEDALHARALLGHRQPETTERYYIRASQLEAGRKVSTALGAIRKRNT